MYLVRSLHEFTCFIYHFSAIPLCLSCALCMQTICPAHVFLAFFFCSLMFAMVLLTLCELFQMYMYCCCRMHIQHSASQQPLLLPRRGKTALAKTHLSFCFSTSSGTAREQQRQRDIELSKEITEHKWNSG